jgi:hypothetical protein
MVLKDFNAARPPLNRAGQGYPSFYHAPGDPGTGKGRISINKTDAISRNSLQMDLTWGSLYVQFNVNDGVRKGFAREYSVNPKGWRFRTYNRLRFWIKVPTSGAPLLRDGRPNYHVGTYVKRVTNADSYDDETGGDHYYHHLNLAPTGTWTQVILNMHPDHRRDQDGGVDQRLQEHPTREREYNYFDALTRFYIVSLAPPSSYPVTYLLDEIEFYREPHQENDEQIYSIAGTYIPAKNRIIVTWGRHKDDNRVRHEIRYAFSNIHEIGWKRAFSAPRGVVLPRGWQGYNNMAFDSTALPLTKKTHVYLGIKPQNSSRFSQIVIPLTVDR